MKKKLLFTMMTAGLMAGAIAQDEAKKEAGAAIGGDKAAAAAEEAVKAKDLGKLLKDQLIKVEGEKVEPAKLEEGMEYYLVYHSASW